MIWLMERAGKKNANNKDWYRMLSEQQHNKPLEIKDQEMFDKTLEYIHLNSVMSGFVLKPEDWKYSSARDFCGTDSIQMKGLIELSYS